LRFHSEILPSTQDFGEAVEVRPSVRGSFLIGRPEACDWMPDAKWNSAIISSPQNKIRRPLIGKLRLQFRLNCQEYAYITRVASRRL
jgi:hypothetical protein